VLELLETVSDVLVVLVLEVDELTLVVMLIP